MIRYELSNQKGPHAMKEMKRQEEGSRHVIFKKLMVEGFEGWLRVIALPWPLSLFPGRQAPLPLLLLSEERHTS